MDYSDVVCEFLKHAAERAAIVQWTAPLRNKTWVCHCTGGACHSEFFSSLFQYEPIADEEEYVRDSWHKDYKINGDNDVNPNSGECEYGIDTAASLERVAVGPTERRALQFGNEPLHQINVTGIGRTPTCHKRGRTWWPR